MSFVSLGQTATPENAISPAILEVQHNIQQLFFWLIVIAIAMFLYFSFSR